MTLHSESPGHGIQRLTRALDNFVVHPETYVLRILIIRALES